MALFGPNDQITRIDAVLGFAASADGRAFVLVADTPDGPINLEVTEHSLRGLAAGLMQAAAACAQRRHDLPSMADSDPARSVHMPASDIQVLPLDGAHKRLVIRTGIIDFSLAIADQAAGDALIWALQG